MGGAQALNLKNLAPEDRLGAIIKDTYAGTNDDGQTHKFWERNLT